MNQSERTLSIGVVGITDFVRFAGAGGDFNPLHHDEVFARAAGFPSVIAMGMLTASMASKLITDWFELSAVRAFDVRFRAKVLPGEYLEARGRVAAPPSCPDESDMHVIFEVVNADGELKLSGTAKIGEHAPLIVDPPTRLQPTSVHANLEARIGEVVDEVRFPIESGKITEFARAMRDDSALFVDIDAARAKGYETCPAPLTFSVASAHFSGGDATALPRRLGLDLSRLVHGEQRWRYNRVPLAGDVLHGLTQVTAVDRRTGPNGQMLRLSLETTYRDVTNEAVLTATALLIELPKP